MSEGLLFNDSLEKIRFAYRLTGLNIDSRKRTIKQNCIYLFNFLWMGTDIIFSFSWMINGIVEGKNFTELTFVAPCLTISVLGDIKALFLLFNESGVHDLIENLRELEVEAMGFESSERNIMIKAEIKFLNIIIRVLNVLNGLMIVVFDAVPLILIAVKYNTTGKLELMLPFFDIYPFDQFDLRIWPFAYFHQIWSECFVLLMICATDYFFFTCCTHIKIQFQLLQQQLQEIIDIRSVSAMGSLDKVDLDAKFQQLIKWHQKIISSASMLEGIYSKSTLFNFCISSFVICLTGFNITTIGDKTFVITSVIFLFMALLQVFFLCFFGDILMSSSMDVADAIYNSRWYLSDVATARKVILIQTRAQDPCKVTASGFADVNLNAFMTICSSAWSYFALLQTMYGSHS